MAWLQCERRHVGTCCVDQSTGPSCSGGVEGSGGFVCTKSRLHSFVAVCRRIAWTARIRSRTGSNKKVRLGYFVKEVDAAEAYDAAVRAQGPARLHIYVNFPRSGELQATKKTRKQLAPRALAEIATDSRRVAERHANGLTSSPYRGVSWSGNTGRWMARISVGIAQRILGSFNSEMDAARAYDVAALASSQVDTDTVAPPARKRKRPPLHLNFPAGDDAPVELNRRLQGFRRKKSRGEEMVHAPVPRVSTTEARAAPKSPNAEGDDCAICLEAMPSGAETADDRSCRLCRTSCGHTFHNDCLAEWLLNGSSCPLCMHRLCSRSIAR
jgi:hypothetical protein